MLPLVFIIIELIVAFILWKLERKDNAKREILKAAAEYDRLRDEEFRELGWTGKY